MKINIEEILSLRERLNEINAVPFDSIDWYENGSPMTIAPVVKEEWKYTGLCNDSFITTGAYQE